MNAKIAKYLPWISGGLFVGVIIAAAIVSAKFEVALTLVPLALFLILFLREGK